MKIQESVTAKLPTMASSAEELPETLPVHRAHPPSTWFPKMMLIAGISTLLAMFSCLGVYFLFYGLIVGLAFRANDNVRRQVLDPIPMPTARPMPTTSPGATTKKAPK